jgi:hypothetical protein
MELGSYWGDPAHVGSERPTIQPEPRITTVSELEEWFGLLTGHTRDENWQCDFMRFIDSRTDS